MNNLSLFIVLKVQETSFPEDQVSFEEDCRQDGMCKMINECTGNEDPLFKVTSWSLR
jgi:hypothetical protein